MKKIGIIGHTGRVGRNLTNLLLNQKVYQLGTCYNKSSLPKTTLLNVFQDNDFVIDFSSQDLVKNILKMGIQCPKPLILCSTGWDYQKVVDDIFSLSQYVPIVIAPNTSLGACIQRYLAYSLSRWFDADYDIDIIEKHHRHKKDVPSGTAKALIESILKVKKDFSLYNLKQEKRLDKQISVSVIRSGNILGEHELLFTSRDEMISIKHTVFDRNLFAKGALKIIAWLEENQPNEGVYNMEDIFAFMKL